MVKKIFNITNSQTGSDLIRFHVRTEKRPQEGYYYNFHYHSAEDDFMAHNNLGDIYWEKKHTTEVVVLIVVYAFK